MARKNKYQEEYLFVDGYNIVNAWQIFLKSAQESLEDTRKRLIEIMLEYQALSGINVIIVFDAHLVKGNSGSREDYNGLKVIYTKEHETADNYIERCIEKIGRKKRVRVATSDQLEQQIILSRGATRISARELELEVFGGRELFSRRQKGENEKNNYHFGKLDDESIKVLKKLGRMKEDT